MTEWNEKAERADRHTEGKMEETKWVSAAEEEEESHQYQILSIGPNLSLGCYCGWEQTESNTAVRHFPNQ